jgi:hypothetical protein
MTMRFLVLLGLVVLSSPAWAQTPATNVRGYAFIDLARAVTSADFESEATLTINAETARFGSDYSVGNRAGLLAGGGMWLGRRRTFGVGAGIYVASRPTTLDVQASIPHPFFFNRPREVAGTLDDVDHKEFAFTVHARLEHPITRRATVTVFGGPAFVRVTQDLFEELDYTETFPYDTVAFQRIATRSATGSAVGFNGGAEATYYLTPRVGIGGGGQYLGATVGVEDAAGDEIDVKAGGFLFNFGVRLRF